jgi:hypothetical protein
LGFAFGFSRRFDKYVLVGTSACSSYQAGMVAPRRTGKPPHSAHPRVVSDDDIIFSTLTNRALIKENLHGFNKMARFL